MYINPSRENYLETILLLSKKRPVVRSVDIAAELNFKKSSVSVAMKKLLKRTYHGISRRLCLFNRIRKGNRRSDL